MWSGEKSGWGANDVNQISQLRLALPELRFEQIPDPDPTHWRPKQCVRAPVPRGCLAGKKIWYEAPQGSRYHRGLVVAGKEPARQQGERIGRPPVNGRSEFERRFAAVVQRIGPEGIPRN